MSGARIQIYGFESFDYWRAARYPGARSFPAREEPDPMRGLCKMPNCTNVVSTFGLCRAHWTAWRERVET